jgi:DNA-binding transcriptional LysR family regulator
MHVETLRVFCDLAELQSFSKTAEKNLLSQSAISQQLAHLELAFRCQLVDRKKRPIELTKAGQVFYGAAQEMLDRYERLKSELNALKATAGNRINIAAIFSIGMHTLPQYVKSFMAAHPNVNVHVEYFSARRIYELVLAGEIDIGLVAVPKRDKRSEVHEFEEEPLVLACSPKHPFAAESHVDIHQLQFERFIAFDKEAPTRQWVDDILQRYNIVVRTVMEFDNIETVKRAVEINSGVSILPRTAILQEVNEGTIKAIPFSNENFIRPTGIIVRKNRVLSQSARNFIELLVEKGARRE